MVVFFQSHSGAMGWNVMLSGVAGRPPGDPGGESSRRRLPDPVAARAGPGGTVKLAGCAPWHGSKGRKPPSLVQW